MLHIDELLAIEAGRAETEKAVISGLTVILRTEEGEVATEVVRPAVPTLRMPLLRRLIHLRLSARQFSSGVEDIEIFSARTQPSRGQEELFSLRGRDLRAGARAFAAIRARFGNESVTCARLSDSHLPERSFQWVPVQRPVLPAPPRERVAPHHPSAVRRILFTPRRMKPIPQAPGEGMEPFVASGLLVGHRGHGCSFPPPLLFSRLACRDSLVLCRQAHGHHLGPGRGRLRQVSECTPLSGARPISPSWREQVILRS